MRARLSVSFPFLLLISIHRRFHSVMQDPIRREPCHCPVIQCNGEIFSLKTILDTWILEPDPCNTSGAYRTYICPAKGQPTTLMDVRIQYRFHMVCSAMGVDVRLPFELQYAADDGSWFSCLLDDQFTFLARMTHVFVTRASMAKDPDNTDVILCNQQVYLRFSVQEVAMPGDFIQYHVRLHGSRRNGHEVKTRVVINDRHITFFPGIQFVE